MYQEGDLIIYQTTGVCRVMGVCQLDFSGSGTLQPYYTLKPLYQTGTICAPVQNPRVFMRPILTSQQVNVLIDQIPSLPAQPDDSKSIQQLCDHYTRAIKSHDCAALLSMVVSIWRKKQALAGCHRKFGQVDSHFMKQAEDLLYGEFAAALQIPKSEVCQYIADRLHSHA
ncbi:MAG: CarD family transcriptional regulator [Pygmaiobacter massiliensis]|nr:CarD family transcriptional regulator [Pygmaiobacter massiliensis]